MKIAEVCTREVQYIEASSALATAAQQMRDKRVGSLIVVAQGTSNRIMGIVTDRDIVCGQIDRKGDLHCLSVEEVMTRDPLLVSADADISEAIAALCGLGVRRAPVVNGAGDLIGIIALDDLTAVLAQQFLLCSQALAA